MDQLQFEMVNLKADVDNARSALSPLRRERDSAARDLAAARSNRAAFSSQIGFEAARQEYVAADSRVDELGSAIAERNGKIAKYDRLLQASLKSAEALAKELEKANAEFSVADGRLAAVLANAKPYHEQEAPILARISSEGARFKESRALYQQLYLYLADSLR